MKYLIVIIVFLMVNACAQDVHQTPPTPPPPVEQPECVFEIYTPKDILYIQGMRMYTELGFNVDFIDIEHRFDFVGAYSAASCSLQDNEILSRQYSKDSTKVRWKFVYVPSQALDSKEIVQKVHYTEWYKVY